MVKVQIRHQHSHSYHPFQQLNTHNMYGTSSINQPYNTNHTTNSRYSRTAATNSYTTTVMPPSTSSSSMYSSNANGKTAHAGSTSYNSVQTLASQQQNSSMAQYRVVKPTVKHSMPNDELIQGPSIKYYSRLVSNSRKLDNGITQYRSITTNQLDESISALNYPFLNQILSISSPEKKRKIGKRPVTSLSVNLLKTYKGINALYYAEKRKKEMQKQSQSVIPSKQLLNRMQPQQQQQQQQNIAYQQQQQQQQALGMTSYQQLYPYLQQQAQQAMIQAAAQAAYQYSAFQANAPQPQPPFVLQSQDFLSQQIPIGILTGTYQAAYGQGMQQLQMVVPPIIPNPAATLYNDGYDDEHGNYVVQINEEIANRYIVQENLGKGSFGVVVKAFDTYTSEFVAVKVIKNKAQFYEQAKLEIAILSDLSSKDKAGEFNVVQMKHFFEWKNHLCLVFELLSYNLYDLLKYTNFKGVSLKLIRKFAQQLLYTLFFLSRPDVNIIHCDLKPENILLKHHRKSLIKVIDFGSSCYINKKMFKYIQSRFYRSPEVLLGLPYSTSIDMWSFGCILVEMHTGLPLFDGKNEKEQLFKIIEVLGMPPRWMIDSSPKKDLFFKYNPVTQEYYLSNSNFVPNSRSLFDIIGVNTNGPEGRRAGHDGHSRQDYLNFYDLVCRILQYDPSQRLLPGDALRHPFFPHAVPVSSSPDSPIGQYYQYQQAQQQQARPMLTGQLQDFYRQAHMPSMFPLNAQSTFVAPAYPPSQATSYAMPCYPQAGYSQSHSRAIG
jgi:serine/threonine protein kinase